MVKWLMATDPSPAAEGGCGIAGESRVGEAARATQRSRMAGVREPSSAGDFAASTTANHAAATTPLSIRDESANESDSPVGGGASGGNAGSTPTKFTI